MNQPFILSTALPDKLYERYREALDIMDMHASYSKEPKEPPQPLDPSQLQRFIETAFWASLQQEESRFHDFTLLLMPQERMRRHYVFDKPIPFNVANVAKLAPALDTQANHIGVWVNEGGELNMWGFAPTRDTGLMAATLDPGQLLVSFKEIGMEHFTLLLSGTEGKFVRRSEFLTWLVPESKTERQMDVWRKHEAEVMRAVDYRDITTMMRSHRHGGTLLVVKEDGEWRQSFNPSVTFAAKEPYDKVRVDTLLRDRTIAQEKENEVIYTESPAFKMAIESGRKSLG
jgi:hypothetical protein